MTNHICMELNQSILFSNSKAKTFYLIPDDMDKQEQSKNVTMIVVKEGMSLKKGECGS